GAGLPTPPKQPTSALGAGLPTPPKQPTSALGAGLPTPPKRPTEGLLIPNHGHRRIRFALLVLLTLSSGCGRQEVDGTYGRRRGAIGGSSVNGTAVLAGLFEGAGHKVKTWRRLSPKLEECDNIVWAPDSFSPPTLEQRQFLEAWLANQPLRTLVYIGRDYDASIDYWRKVQPQSPAEQMMEVFRRLANARAEYEADRAQIPADESCDWFTIRRDAPRRTVTTLKGPWSERIDTTQAEIEIHARLNQPNDKEKKAWRERENNDGTGRPQFQSLLATEDDIDLVTRVTRGDWNDGQILVVANGSFLLNLPLVNHEHRKLAGQLISACGLTGKTVFLESGPGGPVILDQEPNANAPTGFEVLIKWPIGIIALHLIILGTTLCFAFYPIFGRARDVRDELRSDFGRHVDALGDLLESTQDHEYAAEKVRHYREHAKRDSAFGHRGQ
ncbi:MAG: DUF4350 domain-containing protein, partial [Pirellulaceae bacterium]